MRGISSDLKSPLAYFTTDGVTSTQILPLFWPCVVILELNCKLHVFATICDGATPNRKFFKLHRGLDCCTDNEVVYRTINLFDDKRFIFFFSDPFHLVKTDQTANRSTTLSRVITFRKSLLHFFVASLTAVGTLMIDIPLYFDVLQVPQL